MIHISLSLAGVSENATWHQSSRPKSRVEGRTLENSKAGVKSDTLMTFNLRCVALSVMPAMDRM